METPFPGGNRITEGFMCRLTQHAAQQKTKTQQLKGNQTISEQNPFTKPGVSTKHGETTEALCGDGAVGEYLRLCSLFPMIVQTGAGSQCQRWIATSLTPGSLAHTSSHCLTKAGQAQSTLRHHSPCLAHLWLTRHPLSVSPVQSILLHVYYSSSQPVEAGRHLCQHRGDSYTSPLLQDWEKSLFCLTHRNTHKHNERIEGYASNERTRHNFRKRT